MEAFDRYSALLKARPALAANPKGGIVLVSDRSEVVQIEAVMADRFAAAGLPRGWACAGIMYEDPYIILLREAVVFPDGQPGLYHRVIARNEEPTGVAILPRFRGQVALIRHFRHPGRRWHVEIPRGAVGEGEDPAHVAGLEISEEIGGTIGSLLPLGLLHGASAFMRHSVVLAYAELGAIGTPALGEGIAEILLVSPAELEHMILDGTITDAYTVGAAFHAKLRGLL
jgi:ADP-ribose pyrophosphatase